MGTADLALRRSFFSLRRETRDGGGPIDKAVVTGSLLDLRVELARFGRVIANARADAISLRDRIGIHLLMNDHAFELFAIVTMVNLMIQQEARGQDDDSAIRVVIVLLAQGWRDSP